VRTTRHRVEHAASDELIEIIARKLDDPAADPHGNPITTRDLEIDDQATQSLAELQPGEHATLVRVSDSDPALLRHLTEQRITIGGQVEMIARQPFDGPLRGQLMLALYRAVVASPAWP
jgi:DtxR family transcriptional regulator, Mn-dependent transcriptional regulator